MKKTLKSLAIALLAIGTTATVSTVSHAQRGGDTERYVLDYDDVNLRGENTLALKRKLQRQHGISADRLQLQRVRLVAKSRHGQGEAKLVVGQNSTRWQTLDGTPSEFRSNRPATYDREIFQNPSRRSDGRWQIKLQGNIKVKRVVLVVKKPNRAKKFTIDYYGDHLQGENTLFLKRALRDQHGITPADYKLIRVKLVAKSKHGAAQASLFANGSSTAFKTIDGNPRAFRNNRFRTYHSIGFESPASRDRGRWQIDLRGNIKVHSVDVFLKRKR